VDVVTEAFFYLTREILAVAFVAAVVVGVYWAIAHLVGECFDYWREHREEER